VNPLESTTSIGRTYRQKSHQMVIAIIGIQRKQEQSKFKEEANEKGFVFIVCMYFNDNNRVQ
jgi:hypothetical protein